MRPEILFNMKAHLAGFPHPARRLYVILNGTPAYLWPHHGFVLQHCDDHRSCLFRCHGYWHMCA